jgi:hypothetical protein
MPWFGRLLSLPLLAASAYLLWNVGLGLRQDFSGFGRLADDLVPVLVFTGLGLLVGIPGLILLTFRTFVVLNEALRQIVITRQFGPLNIRRQRDLADYHFISITDDCDPQLTTYDVNLCQPARSGARSCAEIAGARLCRHRAGRGLGPSRDQLLPAPEIAILAAKHRNGRP